MDIYATLPPALRVGRLIATAPNPARFRVSALVETEGGQLVPFRVLAATVVPVLVAEALGPTTADVITHAQSKFPMERARAAFVELEQPLIARPKPMFY